MKTLSISPGNQKLGQIPNFSLPALKTCPGMTAACARVCYANKGRSRFHQAGAWLGNYRRVFKEKSSLLAIVALCRGTRARVFRFHVSGDFYSAAYVKAWRKVARLCPNTVFFGYTRSWRVDNIRPELEKLRAMPNVRLWASCDKFTGPAPKTWRAAYMALSDTENPGQVDLVFRVSRAGIKKHFDRVPVCPKENGTKAGGEINCLTCGICYR